MSDNSLDPLDQPTQQSDPLDTSVGASTLSGFRASVENASDTGVTLPAHAIPAWDTLYTAMPKRTLSKLQAVVELLTSQQQEASGTPELAAPKQFTALKTEYESEVDAIAINSGLNREDIQFRAVLESLAMNLLIDDPGLLSKVLNSIERNSERDKALRESLPPFDQPSPIAYSTPFVERPERPDGTTKDQAGPRTDKGSDREERGLKPVGDGPAWKTLYTKSENGRRQAYGKVRTVSSTRQTWPPTRDPLSDDPFGAVPAAPPLHQKNPDGEG